MTRREIVTVAALIGGLVAIPAVPAFASPVAPMAPSGCHPGVYGLAGDWGPGSKLADTVANRALIRREYLVKGDAYRIIHNIRPVKCGGAL